MYPLPSSLLVFMFYTKATLHYFWKLSHYLWYSLKIVHKLTTLTFNWKIKELDKWDNWGSVALGKQSVFTVDHKCRPQIESMPEKRRRGQLESEFEQSSPVTVWPDNPSICMHDGRPWDWLNNRTTWGKHSLSIDDIQHCAMSTFTLGPNSTWCFCDIIILHQQYLKLLGHGPLISYVPICFKKYMMWGPIQYLHFNEPCALSSIGSIYHAISRPSSASAAVHTRRLEASSDSPIKGELRGMRGDLPYLGKLSLIPCDSYGSSSELLCAVKPPCSLIWNTQDSNVSLKSKNNKVKLDKCKYPLLRKDRESWSAGLNKRRELTDSVGLKSIQGNLRMLYSISPGRKPEAQSCPPISFLSDIPCKMYQY